MPPRRRTTQRRSTSSSKSRVHAIKSLDQFNAALAKGGAKKVVIVQFHQASVWACKQLRPIYARYSALPAFKNGIFIEVDIDENEDIGRAAQVKRIPTYQCYFDGELVDMYAGTAPSEMRNFIEKNIKEYCQSTGMPTWQRMMLGAVALVGAGTAWWMSSNGRTSKETVAQTARDQILDIKQRIVTAQGRLKNLEKANRGKQAKVQRKLIEQLNAQRRALERTQQAAETKSVGKAGESPEKGTLKPSAILEKTTIDDVARIRHRKRQGYTLYSDEEDILDAYEAKRTQES